MHLDLERKSNAPGGCEGDTQADQRVQSNRHNNNNNNTDSSNNNNRNSHNHRGQVDSGVDSRDRSNEGANEGHEERGDEPNGRSVQGSEHPGERGMNSSTKDMEMGNSEERKSRIVDPDESTTALIIEKSSIAENRAMIKPMLEKPGISENKIEGKKMYQYLSTLIVGLLAMQGGMCLGWTSPILPFLKDPKVSFLPDGLTDSKESWVCSLLALGAVAGAVPSGKVADRIGRKVAIIATALPFLVSWLILIFRRDLTSLYVARFIGGIGDGAVCVLGPVYVGEIAEPSIRGALGAFFPLFFSLGIVYAYVAGAYTAYATFNVSCCLTLIPFFICMYFVPESPMWLVHKNHMKKAASSLRILRGRDYDPKREIALLQIESDRVENRRGGFRDLIGTRAGRKALITCVGLMWFQQMSGIDAVLFYTVSIFQDAGSTIEPFIATIVIGIVEVIMAIVVALVIDRFGRKPLLILSGTGMTLCLAVLGYYFKLQSDHRDVSSIGWLPLTSLALFNVVFSVGYGSVPFAVIAELFPPETKGVASSLTVVVNWTLVFTVTKIFPSMVEYMGQAATFWSFGCMTALSSVFAFLLVPETKGKTLQEIQTKLELRKRRKEKLSMQPA